MKQFICSLSAVGFAVSFYAPEPLKPACIYFGVMAGFWAMEKILIYVKKL